MRRLIAAVSIATVLTLAACGGGGGSSDLSGGGGGTTPPPPSGNNVATLTVDAGPDQNSVNTPFVSVTVCSPGSTANCQTVDHIEVDTGSYGLRIIASALSSSFALPFETDSNGNTIVECTVFADGISWGPVETADIQIAGEAASSVPVQIIGSSSFATPPADCSSRGTTEDSVETFGANGILGVGAFVQDDGFYYTCPQGTCAPIEPSLNEEVSNPVAFFATDNNGVVVELPSVPAAGASSLTGSLIFGIGTESNNALGTATVYTLDPDTGNLSITFNSSTFSSSFIDSGSNANYFVDSAINTCTSGFFCPPSTLSLSATVTGINNANASVSFSVANADDLFNGNTSGVAFNNLAAPESDTDSFDFGLPFFFGRNVFTAIADQSTPGGNGPYVAF
jgi:Protein of unknown function (DUF3443)